MDKGGGNHYPHNVDKSHVFKTPHLDMYYFQLIVSYQIWQLCRHLALAGGLNIRLHHKLPEDKSSLPVTSCQLDLPLITYHRLLLTAYHFLLTAYRLPQTLQN